MVNEQSAAERILHRARRRRRRWTMVSGCGRSRLIGRHRVGAGGELTLELPQDCRLATAATAPGAVEVSVELTDIAPTAMRDRVRAQVTLGGALRYTGRGPTDTESNTLKLSGRRRRRPAPSRDPRAAAAAPP